MWRFFAALALLVLSASFANAFCDFITCPCSWGLATCDNRAVCMSDAQIHYRYLPVGGGRTIIVSQAVGPVRCTDGSTYHVASEAVISGKADGLEVEHLTLVGNRGDVLVVNLVWQGYGNLVNSFVACSNPDSVWNEGVIP